MDRYARSLADEVIKPKWISLGGSVLTALGGLITLSTAGAAAPFWFTGVAGLTTAGGGCWHIVVKNRKHEYEIAVKARLQVLFEEDGEMLREVTNALQILERCSLEDQKDILNQLKTIAFAGSTVQ